MGGVLDGVRILDLSQYLAGPHATLLLAGMGAEVIRVDNPKTGDTLSGAPVFHGAEGPSVLKRAPDDIGIAFLKRLRGKKSITLDLKSEAGRDLLLKLAAKSDVLLENFSVGVTERLGIDWPEVRKVNPRLIYCSLTGYGSTGPDRHRRAFDATTQAVSGLMSVTGHPGGPPTKAGTPLADTISAGFAFAAVLGALYHRERTGRGQFVDVSMVDVLFSLIFDEPLDVYERLGLNFQQGNRIMRFAPFNVYPAADGWLVIGVGGDPMWRTLAGEMGRPDLADAEGWREMPWRVANVEVVDAVIRAWTADQTVAALVDRLTDAGVVASPVHTIDDLLKWPHLRERGMIEGVEHPTLGPLPGLHAAGFPLKFSDAETGYRTPAALTGSHSRAVLAELLDLSDADLDRLAGDGVI